MLNYLSDRVIQRLVASSQLRSTKASLLRPLLPIRCCSIIVMLQPVTNPPSRSTLECPLLLYVGQYHQSNQPALRLSYQRFSPVNNGPLARAENSSIQVTSTEAVPPRSYPVNDELFTESGEWALIDSAHELSIPSRKRKNFSSSFSHMVARLNIQNRSSQLQRESAPIPNRMQHA